MTGQGKHGSAVGAGQEKVEVEVGAARAVEPEPFGIEKALVALAVIATTIICVGGLLFIEYLFETLCDVVFQTIIGLFATLFVVD